MPVEQRRQRRNHRRETRSATRLIGSASMQPGIEGREICARIDINSPRLDQIVRPESGNADLTDARAVAVGRSGRKPGISLRNGPGVRGAVSPTARARRPLGSQNQNAY